MRYLILFMAIGLTALGIGVGCTQKSASNNSSSSLNPGLLYQAPTLVGALTDNNNKGALVCNITNLLGANYSCNGVVSPASLTLDLSKSVGNGAAPDPVTAVVTSSNGTVTPLGGNKFTLAWGAPALGAVSIVMTDAYGLQSTINFSVPVQCNLNKMPPIVWGSNPLAISAVAGNAGYVSITVTPPTGGTGSGFWYSIDVNGDKRLDDYNQQAWNTSNVFNPIYDLYNGTRNVTINAMDTQCFIIQPKTVAVNYIPILPAIQSGATASTSTSYYYVQEDVAATTGSSDPADTVSQLASSSGPFDAMDSGLNQDAGGYHVRCNYSWDGSSTGTVSVTGYNYYSDGNPNTEVEAALAQQTQIKFNIPDNGTSQSFSVGAQPVQTLTYQTAAAPDGSYAGYTFSNDNGANCTSTAVISKSQAQGLCANGNPGGNGGVVTMSGVYSCSSLSTGGVSSKSISMKNGYFYCQYNTADNCVGGGQEGGNPPPQF